MMIVASTGFFDGVHLGHRMVLEKTCSLARECGGRSLAITFWPHPRAVLQKDADKLRLLTSLKEKERLCRAIGIDDFVVIPFTRELSEATAEEFIREYLSGHYDVSTLVLGYDHRMGCKTNLSPEDMAVAVRSCGITPVCLENFAVVDGKAVSSTLIRALIAEGRISEAANCLGYNYRIEGIVVSGNRIGRTIGFPTANLALSEPLKLIPAGGVYSVTVNVEGERYRGICNIGTRPTVGDGRGQTIETHILDFDREIYGLEISVEFVERIRDEQRFPSMDELKKQLAKDRNFVLNAPCACRSCAGTLHTDCRIRDDSCPAAF